MKKILFTCLVSFFVLGCSRDLMQNDENPSSGKTESISKGGGRTDIIDVEFETTLPQNLKAKDTRALKEREPGESGGPVLIDYSRMTDTPVTVYLCLKNSNSGKTYHTLSGNIKNVNGAYKLSISRQKLKINGDFSSGSWQACALIDAKNSYTNENGYCPEVNTFNYTSGGDLGNMSVPLYSKYTNITAGSTKTIRLNFQPMGCVIKTTMRNPLAESINVSTVRLHNSNAAAGKVKICFGEEQNNFPKFEKADYKNGKCDIPFDYKESIQSSGSKTTYAYCFPINETQTATSSYEVVYGLSRNLSSKDSITMSYNTRNRYNRVRFLEHGKSYTMNCSLPESDLMITEMLHSNPGGWNSSVIEIYNPTDHPIDLSDYALARMRAWNRSSGGSNEGYVAEWQGYSTKHRPFKYALMQSLYIDPSKQDSYGSIYRGDGRRVNDDRGWTIGYKDNAEDPSQTETSSYNWAKNRYRLMYVNRQSHKYNKMLQPGKCIVLCAGNMYSDYNKRRPAGYKTFPEGSDVYQMPYLANAVHMGYCQYVIAVDNGNKENDYQWGDQGGTFQHGSRHIMVLCKRNGEGTPYKPIDFMMGVHTIERWERIHNSFDFSGTLSAAKDYTWYGRKEGVMYPTYIKEYSDYYDKSKDKWPESSQISINTLYEYYDWYTIMGFPGEFTTTQRYKKYSPGTPMFYEDIYNYNNKLSGAPTVYD